MKERKDIQAELSALTKGMTLNNIYSQISYWIAENCLDQRNVGVCAAYMNFLGLLSDSYWGIVATRYSGWDGVKDGLNKIDEREQIHE